MVPRNRSIDVSTEFWPTSCGFWYRPRLCMRYVVNEFSTFLELPTGSHGKSHLTYHEVPRKTRVSRPWEHNLFAMGQVTLSPWRGFLVHSMASSHGRHNAPQGASHRKNDVSRGNFRGISVSRDHGESSVSAMQVPLSYGRKVQPTEKCQGKVHGIPREAQCMP